VPYIWILLQTILHINKVEAWTGMNGIVVRGEGGGDLGGGEEGWGGGIGGGSYFLLQTYLHLSDAVR